VLRRVAEQPRSRDSLLFLSHHRWKYYKAVQPARFSADVHVVECVFLDQHRVKSVYAKRARGLMARYVVTHGVARAAATSRYVTGNWTGRPLPTLTLHTLCCENVRAVWRNRCSGCEASIWRITSTWRKRARTSDWCSTETACRRPWPTRGGTTRTGKPPGRRKSVQRGAKGPRMWPKRVRRRRHQRPRQKRQIRWRSDRGGGDYRPILCERFMHVIQNHGVGYGRCALPSCPPCRPTEAVLFVASLFKASLTWPECAPTLPRRSRPPTITPQVRARPALLTWLRRTDLAPTPAPTRPETWPPLWQPRSAQ